MINVYLKGACEGVADRDFGLGFPPLVHQVQTFEALQKKSLVINLSDTGAGKTLAALLYLKELDSRGKNNNVLFIAPTNELLRQHERDISGFIDEHALNFNVIRVDADLLAKIKGRRRGETLHRLIMNPYGFREILTKEVRKGAPMVLITNPDIFYYAIFFRYHSHDQRNLFQDFISRFNYIIIDEFHYYNPKQFANFLFYFTLSKSFGYFEYDDRKICLLSATPSSYVEQYLARLGIEVEIVCPGEQKASRKINTMSPARVTFVRGTMEDSSEIDKIIFSEYERGHDGAVISNSLITVNRLYSRFKKLNAGRITGPQDEAGRRKASERRIIFATPTVDIGYNFVKPEKKRQNIDFICCEANSYDQLIQRMGRAGRVLGKGIADYPSNVYVFLGDEDYEIINGILEEGKTYSRDEFKEILLENDVPPQLRSFVNYVKSDAILEAMYTVSQIKSKLLPREEHDELKQFYKDLKDVFNPKTQKSYNYYQKIMSSYYYQKRKVEEKNKAVSRKDAESFFKWLGEAVTEDNLDKLLKNPGFREEVYAHIERQYYTKEAIFNFRNSFNRPVAAVYDPGRLLSDNCYSKYDLFHLLRNYKLHFLEKDEYTSISSQKVNADFYTAIDDMREPSERLKITFKYLPEVDNYDLFHSRFINIPVALKGIELIAKKQGEIYPLPGKVKEAIKERYILTFIASEEVAPALFKKIKNTGTYAEIITVDYIERHRDYSCVMGTAALLIYPELVKAIHSACKRKADDLPVIL